MQPFIQSEPIVQRPLWSTPISIGCALGLILFTIAAVIVLALIPVYLNRQNTSTSSSTNTPTLNASYLVLNGDASSLTSINSIDQTQASKSFSQGLGLTNTDSLTVQGLSQDSVVAATRKKRYIQCDRGTTNVNGIGLIFQFNLHQPSRLPCQNDACKTKTYEQIYQRFQTVTQFSVQLGGITLQLQLCSIGTIIYISSESNTTSSSSTITTSSTTPSSSTITTSSTTSTSSTITTSSTTSSSSTTTISNTITTSNAVHNTWEFVSDMSSPRYQPSDTITTDGNFVVISGSSSIYNIPSISLSAIDTFDEDGNLISSKNMLIPRNFHTTDHLPSSNVILFAGGINAPNGTKLQNAELFNLVTNTSTLINMSSIRFDHQSVVINSSNKIILIGGTNENGTESTSGDVFNGISFTPVLNQMQNGRRYHTITYLPTINKILIAGGETTINCNHTILNTLELYNIATNMFETLNTVYMSSPRSLHTATYISSPSPLIIFIGGSSNGTNTLNTYDIFSVTSLTFITNGTLQSARAAHSATLIKNNSEILIVGGYSSNEAINLSYQPIAPCEIFNITTMSSTIVENINIPRALHTAILMPNTNDVLCCGGVNSNNTALASCERYFP